jgi:8-oxo-dGTP pyrophosphatase MutT (NUDIX family)
LLAIGRLSLNIKNGGRYQLKGLSTTNRAGLVPYYIDNGILRMLFMVPSKAGFGGVLPQIAKGKQDLGETIETAAIREGSEELGIKTDNVRNLCFAKKDRVEGRDEYFDLYIFVAEIKNPKGLGKPTKETKEVVWLTYDEFRAGGRVDQHTLVADVVNFVGD